MKPLDDLWNDLPWVRDDADAGTDRDAQAVADALSMADRLESDEPLETLLAGVTGNRRLIVTEGGRQTLGISMHEQLRGLPEARGIGRHRTPGEADPTTMRIRRLAASLLRRAAAAPFSPQAWRVDPVQIHAGAIAAGLADDACEHGIRVNVRLATPLLPALGTYDLVGRGRIEIALPTTTGGAVFLTSTDGCVSLNENGMSVPFGPLDAMERLRLERAAAATPAARAWR
jgi:hypothetical protein